MSGDRRRRDDDQNQTYVPKLYITLSRISMQIHKQPTSHIHCVTSVWPYQRASTQFKHCIIECVPSCPCGHYPHNHDAVSDIWFPLVQGYCGFTPNKLQQFWFDLFCCMYYGVPSTTKKSPRDSEWRISNYQGSKVKVSLSETRIQKWANNRCTYRVWCRFIGNRP